MKRELVDTYRFEDPDGRLLFTKERFSTPYGKSFRYRCPCRTPEKVRVELPDSRWKTWTNHKPNAGGHRGCKGTVNADDYLLNLPQVLGGMKRRAVWWTEGEKDANTLCGLGALATSTHQGAGHSTPEQAAWLAGARGVWLCMDRDVPGAREAWDKHLMLKALGVRTRIVLPAVEVEGADITDHFAAGFGKHDLIEPPLEWVEEEANKYTRAIGARYGYEVA